MLNLASKPPAMALVTSLQIEEFEFPASVRPSGSSKDLILAGAGVRGFQKPDMFLKVNAIGVYLEPDAISQLAANWNGKKSEDLAADVGFFHDIITCPHEKFLRVSMFFPLTGEQYAGKLMEFCTATWQTAGTYGEDEKAALGKLEEAFKEKKLSPGSSVLFGLSPTCARISFSKDGRVGEDGGVAIENGKLGEAILEWFIGKEGISPALKTCLAERLPKYFTNQE